MKQDKLQKVYSSYEEYEKDESLKRKGRVKLLIWIIFVFSSFALFLLNNFLGIAFFFFGLILMGNVLSYFTGDDA